jgi:serine phosphatase RsbU (regulator of sigma subunit)
VLVQQGVIRELRVQGLPLGMLADVRHEPLRVAPEPGDIFVAFSDGVCESVDPERDAFGARWLQSQILRLAGRPAREIAQELLRSCKTFVGDSARGTDDRTVVVLKFT